MKIFNIVLFGLSLTACLKPVYAQQACSCPKDKWCEHKPVWIPKELYNSQYPPIIYPNAVKHIESRKIKASKAEELFNFSLNHKYKPYIIRGDDYLTDSGNDFYDNELRNKLYMVWRGLEQLPIKHWYDEKGVFLGLRTWLRDAALNNPIILYLYDDDKDPSAGMTSPYFNSNFSEHNTNGNDAWIGLGIYAGWKERQIFFKNPSISNPREESMKATMAHEMGHVFLVHAWPNLRDADNLPAYVAHESFAVYTEYLYLKELAAKGYITPFNIIDFIKDAANRTSGGPSQFTVSADYILCFLKGLDYSNLIEDAKGNIVDIPFDYSFLKRASDICGKLKNNQQVSDKDYKYKLVFLRHSKAVGYRIRDIKEEKSVMIDYRLAVGKDAFLEESTKYMASVPPMGVDFPDHHEPWISMQLDPIKDSEAIKQEKKKKMEATRKQVIQDVLNHLVNHNLQQCSKDDNIINIDSPHR